MQNVMSTEAQTKNLGINRHYSTRTFRAADGNTVLYAHRAVLRPSAHPRPPPYHLPKPPSSSVVRTTSPLPSMSHATVSSPSNFQLIISNALDQYKKRTKTDLITHPLAAQLQSCNSPNAILAILQQQVQALYQSRSSDERWSRWLDPTVNVIYALSSTVAAGVSLVCLGT